MWAVLSLDLVVWFWDHMYGWPWTHQVAEDVLELLVLLLLNSMCLDCWLTGKYYHIHLYVVLGMKLRAFCMLFKCSTNWVTSQALVFLSLWHHITKLNEFYVIQIPWSRMYGWMRYNILKIFTRNRPDIRAFKSCYPADTFAGTVRFRSLKQEHSWLNMIFVIIIVSWHFLDWYADILSLLYL